MPTAPGDTLSILQNEITDAKVTHLEVRVGGKEFTLDRGDDWTLPGKWPTRKHEAEELVHLITSLRSRFAMIPTGDGILKEYGLDEPAATVKVWVGKQPYTLMFSEEKGFSEGGRFSVPTYLCVDNQPEIVRLAPGILGILGRPADYYQQRRLFIDTDRVAKSDNPERQDRATSRPGDRGRRDISRAATPSR